MKNINYRKIITSILANPLDNLIILIEDHPDESLNSIKGKIIDETKYMINLRTDSNSEISIPKKGGKFIISSGNLNMSVDGDILIISLLDKQDIHFEMKAELNIAKEHSKWQSAVVGYSYESDNKNSVSKNEKIIFNIRSISGLSPKQILIKAIDVIDKRLDLFEEAVNLSDFLMVGVPTPMKDDGSQDLSNMNEVVEGIDELANEKKI